MSRPAPFARAVIAQAVVELRLTTRRGENLLAMIGIPVALLLLFGSAEVQPAPATGSRVEALLPGILALAIIATGSVNLGIATAYERSYGVLKRLGGSPLGRPGLIAAKILAVLVIELILVVVLTTLATVALGWRPSDSTAWPLLVASIGLGTATFAAFGLAMAGALRAEATLLLANVSFLLVLAFGGVLIPVADLPEPMNQLAALLPPAALTEALGLALGNGGGAPQAVLVLAIWAVIAVTLAIRTFRWD